MTVHSLDPRIKRTRSDVTSTALEILLERGWDSVTHAEVARRSGYSRATIYSHWPTQFDLVRDAFKEYEELPHSDLTGVLVDDLQAELASFVSAMVNYRLDRALAMLAERAQTNPEVVTIRDSFVTAGENPMRAALHGLNDSRSEEALTLMLCGMITHSVLMHGTPPEDEVIEKAIEIVLPALVGQK